MDTTVIVHVSNEIVTTVSLVLNAVLGVIAAVAPLVTKIRNFRKR